MDDGSITPDDDQVKIHTQSRYFPVLISLFNSLEHAVMMARELHHPQLTYLVTIPA
jgi:hypothetical protein